MAIVLAAQVQVGSTPLDRLVAVVAHGAGRGYGSSVDRYDPLDRLVYGAMDDDEMDTILDALERANAEDGIPERLPQTPRRSVFASRPSSQRVLRGRTLSATAVHLRCA